LERRFLVSAVPGGVPVRTVDIVDRYIDGTRLRLRRETSVGEDGTGNSHYKLTQKVPSPDGGPGLITTIYLGPTEHRVLDGLPGAVLRKTRLSIPPFGVDIFAGPLEGLVLAEAEFSFPEEMSAFVPPRWVGPEVTSDGSFSGGSLVHATREALQRALAPYGLAD
jgi:hypothetical protein